jgi:hypothetical protein
MSYVLATTTKQVQWYKFKASSDTGSYELVDVLDLNVVPMFGDKESAKFAAQGLGLKTWRYVKL